MKLSFFLHLKSLRRSVACHEWWFHLPGWAPFALMMLFAFPAFFLLKWLFWNLLWNRWNKTFGGNILHSLHGVLAMMMSGDNFLYTLFSKVRDGFERLHLRLCISHAILVHALFFNLFSPFRNQHLTETGGKTAIYLTQPFSQHSSSFTFSTREDICTIDFIHKLKIHLANSNLV